MARPTKCRKVRGLPTTNCFGPTMAENTKDAIIMTIEEYETIRLIDYKNYTQAEASTNMEIARTTVQQIYNDARSKLSKALVEGRNIIITGGNYQIEESCDHLCHKKACQGNSCNCPKLSCHERK